jgi:hypothetical protein
MIQNPSEPRGADFKYHHYQEPCSRLKNLIARLPVNPGRVITPFLVGCVNRVYTELKANPQFRDACEEIAPMVVKSVIHRYKFILNFIRCPSHPHERDIYLLKNCDLIYKALPLLEGPLDVRLGAANRSECTSLELGALRDTLKKFSSRSCLDSDIETLANDCKQLTHLDISCSTDISDRVVDHILKFNHLLELNLWKVHSLSQEALQHLLTSLAEVDVSEDEEDTQRPPVFRSQILMRLGCSNLTDQHISLISKFNNVSILTLSNVNCFLTPLRDIRRILMLTLSDSRFVLVEELLLAIGNGLVCLNLIDVIGTDFNFIMVNCYKVNCLHLCFKEKEHLILPENWNLPGAAWHRSLVHWGEFLQVSISDLHVVQYILTRFPYLTRLMLSNSVDDVFLEGLMQRVRNPHLKNLFWGDSLEITFNGGVASVRKFCSDGEPCMQQIMIRNNLSDKYKYITFPFH